MATHFKNFNSVNLPYKGCYIKQFLQVRCWKKSAWLTEAGLKVSNLQMKKLFTTLLMSVIAEKQKSVISAINKNTKPNGWYYRRFSPYNGIVSLIAWILRFVNKENRIQRRCLNLHVLKLNKPK